jgi:hypothetical protein
MKDTSLCYNASIIATIIQRTAYETEVDIKYTRSASSAHTSLSQLHLVNNNRTHSCDRPQAALQALIRPACFITPLQGRTWPLCPFSVDVVVQGVVVQRLWSDAPGPVQAAAAIPVSTLLLSSQKVPTHGTSCHICRLQQKPACTACEARQQPQAAAAAAAAEGTK